MAKEIEATVVPEMHKRIQRLEREFSQLLRRAETAEVHVRERVHEQRKEFERKRAALVQRLERTKNASAAARDELSSGLETAWNELSDALNAAQAELMAIR